MAPVVLLAALAAFAARADGQPAAAPDSVARAHAPIAAESAAVAPHVVTGPVAPLLATDTTISETVAQAPEAAVPVFLGGKEIFRIRAPYKGRTPAERAASIRALLDEAVADTGTPADSVRLVRIPDGIEVRLGDHLLWVTTIGDVRGLSIAEVAHMMSGLPSRVAEGIRKERLARRPLGVFLSVLIALGITVLAFVLVRLLMAASRRWRALLDRALPRYLTGVRIGTFEVLSQAQLTGIVGAILARLDLVVGLLLLYGYLTALFSLFPWSQAWSWELLHFAREELIDALRTIGSAIPGLLVLAAIFIVFRWLTQISDRFFEAVDAGTLQFTGFHRDLARPTRQLMRIGLWVSAAAIAYPYIPGSQSKAVQGVSILLGVMVSLGSSGIVGNVMAGIVLTYSRSFHLGDLVRIGDHIGVVVDQGFFATKLRSIRNEEITLPNGQVASQPILNYTRLEEEGGLVLHTQVTIGYDADWRTVHGLLIEAASRVEGVEKALAPWVWQRSLNDHHITYEICCVTHRSREQLKLYSRLHEEIQDAFARAGVEILSPAYHALRDANAPVLPDEPKGPRAEPGGFRVRPPRDA